MGDGQRNHPKATAVTMAGLNAAEELRAHQDFMRSNSTTMALDSGHFGSESIYGGSQTAGDDMPLDEEQSPSIKDRQELRKASRRMYCIALLLILGGTAASACFLYFGISASASSEQDRFQRHAHDLSKEIQSSFRDYETAAAWIHEACRDWRDSSFTRHDFRVLYNYIIDGGLDFFLAEWVPRVTLAERPALEAESYEYYADDPTVDYRGFVGLGPNPEDEAEFGLFPSPQEPVYFPIQFLEPYERIGEAAHLDLYSIIYERAAIDLAVQTFEPVLTERFVIVSQETDGYSVSLIHPGVKLPDDIAVEPKDLSLMLIHIRSLLARAARFQGTSLAVYLYDATQVAIDGSPQQYLGGAMIEVDIANEVRDITYYNEIELEEVREQGEEDLFFEAKMEVGQRNWTIVVMPVDDTYEADNRISILCGVMILAASILLSWIWIINNRKRSNQVINIMNKAAAESAIVSNLFPAVVRDRLIQQKTAAVEQHPANNDPVNAKNKNYQTDPSNLFGRYSKEPPSSSEGGSDLDDSYRGVADLPIAELYPETTVLFADLAGFTKWSSTRSPALVFKLLETFYQAFDEIATRRKVFKVETIGDCYVAVTGLPKAQPGHAVIMARFANACMAKMNQLVGTLVEELGEDTLQLQMRVGLNSGSVTAGVLRGQKSRFQLFGDTVNTAARMESHGIKGSIHCSQSTADALVEAGKAHWLETRQDKIVAKGKGEMQTYFISVLPEKGSESM